MAPRYLGDGRLGQFVAPEGGVEAGQTYLIEAILVVATTTSWGGGSFIGAISGAWELHTVPTETWPEGVKM
jgi:predicted RecA/RadA family phage recombinase